ncbi:PREDICTED: enolase-like [Lupinus angustifolius]|uniref:enolase-like n=1 Tax=Lupinus angustifolius TaxID=3871 RepID=UPI00092EE4AB|nr:PREDICTED: enolase-like [Lupinus angustifolius]
MGEPWALYYGMYLANIALQFVLMAGSAATYITFGMHIEKQLDVTIVVDGICPNIQENKESLELLKTTIAKAGYTGKVVIGMDVTASGFYDNKDKTYDLISQKSLGINLLPRIDKKQPFTKK